MDSKTQGIVSGDPAFLYLVIILISIMPVNMVSETLKAVLNALEQYQIVARLSIVQPLIYFCLLGGLTIAQVSAHSALYWLATYLGIISVVILSWYSMSLYRLGWIRQVIAARKISKSSSYIYNRYFKTYTQPMSISVIFHYAKTQLPTVLLGQASSFNMVAYYKFFKDIFNIAEMFFPKIGEIILPSLVKMKESNLNFTKQYLRYSHLYLVLMSGFSLLILLCHPILLNILGLLDRKIIILIIAVIGINSIFRSEIFVFNYLFILESDIKHFYIQSFCANSVNLILLLMLFRYGVMGILAAEFCRRIVEKGIVFYFSIKKDLIRKNEMLQIAIIALFFCIVIIAVSLGQTMWLNA